jgi:hypothetical protein
MIPLAGATMLIMFGGIALSSALNLWKTEGSKEPVKFSQGQFAGQPNPSDIRGSYTWLDLEKNFGINGTEAAAAFSFGSAQLVVSERLNVLETMYVPLVPSGKEIGTDSVRLFVALLTSLPHNPEEGTALPPGAIAYLEERGKIDAQGKERWTAALAGAEGSTAQAAASPAPTAVSPAAGAAAAGTPGTAAGTAAGTAPAAETHVRPDRFVSGQTTVGELYTWGLTEAEVAKTLGFTPKNRTSSIKDEVSAAGGSFGSIKTVLQGLVDSKAKN